MSVEEMVNLGPSLAVQAIHDLNVTARVWAYEGRPHAEIAELLDGIDYLTSLYLDSRGADETDIFLDAVRSYAESSGTAYAWDRLAEGLDREPARESAGLVTA